MTLAAARVEVRQQDEELSSGLMVRAALRPHSRKRHSTCRALRRLLSAEVEGKARGRKKVNQTGIGVGREIKSEGERGRESRGGGGGRSESRK